MKHFIKLTVFFLLPLMLALLFGKVSFVQLFLIILSSLLLAAVFSTANQSNLFTRLFRYFLLFSYACLLFFVLFKSILFDFTGAGFENDVYYHLSWESFKVGFNEYTWQLSLLFAFIMAYFFLAEHLVPTNERRFNWFYVLTLTVLYCATLIVTPLGEFLRGYHAYNNNSIETSLDKLTVQPFIDAEFINNIDLQPKHQITASTNDKKNLILIYLESFNQFLLDDPKFNTLTPNMNNLGDEFQHFKHENSAFVTIEGIISSQCGTLLTMSSGNDSFMKKSDAMSELPCLSDVLKIAGYDQYFLGGAKMEFAGKGDFLKTHGYDHLWGLEYWLSLEKNSDLNIWGLSDTALFQEAIEVIRKAAKNPPYNLTLLTLGTHIPGFVYPGCEGIENENQFLAAISCTDLLLTQFIDNLKAENLLDDTLLVIVSDHGVFPNPKMEALFGEKVFDRRLVGITNYKLEDSSQALSSYDLAPTILDWLNIQHNTKFLFGRTLKDHYTESHQHISRYTDWHNGKVVRNTKGECQLELSSKGTLNSCEKDKIKAISQQVLQQFAKPIIGNKLECSLAIKVDFTGSIKQLLINENNQYQNFHYQGFNLESRQFDTGHFIFAINNNLQIIDTRYNKLSTSSDQLPTFKLSEINDKTTGAIELIVTDENSHLQTSVFYHAKNTIEIEPNVDVFNVNLCEN